MKPLSLTGQFLRSLSCNLHRYFLRCRNHPSQVLGMTTQSWSPLEFLDTRNTTLQYAVLILNRPIIVPRADMFSLWNRACVRITVDGGTNRWYEYAKSEEDCALPDMIIGDLDSATVEVLNYYQEREVNIIRTPDQNETDFTKALRKTASYARNRQLKLDAVIAVAQTSGRLDQIIGIINTLHKADGILDGLPVFIYSGTSLTWLLAPGKHYIDLRKYRHLLGKWCSLMPLGKPAHHVTTTGLKWNLVDRVMEFGGMVSTSNAYGSELEITVQTDSSLVWSMSVGEDVDDT